MKCILGIVIFLYAVQFVSDFGHAYLLCSNPQYKVAVPKERLGIRVGCWAGY